MQFPLAPLQYGDTKQPYLRELLQALVCFLKLLFQLRDGPSSLCAAQESLLQLPDARRHLVDLVVTVLQVTLALLLNREQNAVVLSFVCDKSLQTFHLSRNTKT